MRPFAKALAITTAAAAVALVPLASAQARGWHHHHHHGDALALGALGLAAGAIIGGAIASDPGPRYVEPPVRYYPAPPPRVVYTRPAPVYVAGALQPWTPSWYRYCEDRYRSFNPRTGTFMGYDGQHHFCTAN